jgi:hypothetical protein
MRAVKQELEHFTNYARRQIESGQENLSIDELFDQWRTQYPSDDQLAEKVAAIQASINDFNEGERGTVAGEDSAHLRRRFGDNVA